MLDIKILREDPEKVKAKIITKKFDGTLVDKFTELDTKWRALSQETESLRAEQKKLGDAKDIEGAKKLKEEIKGKADELAVVEKERLAIWKEIPNLPFDEVVIEKDESENKVIRQWGEVSKFDFEVKDHVALGEKLDIIDIETASQVSGARFNYLKGGAALLEFALIQHTLKVLQDEEFLKKAAATVRDDYPATPFTPVITPQMIRPEVFERMDRIDPKEERYHIESDDLYLIGSAEHTLGPLLMDKTVAPEQLPIRYVGFSTSFRREAGSYGKDTRGILRVHQFDKLEMETFTLPENGTEEQDFIVAVQEQLLQSLDIPYQVVSICTGDMGKPDARQIDIESWIPSQDKYRETHTSDLMTDYQARRLNARVKREDGSLDFLHMNDATAFAIGRTLIAIIENNQTAEGHIKVPEALVPYVGKDLIS